MGRWLRAWGQAGKKDRVRLEYSAKTAVGVLAKYTGRGEMPKVELQFGLEWQGTDGREGMKIDGVFIELDVWTARELASQLLVAIDATGMSVPRAPGRYQYGE